MINLKRIFLSIFSFGHPLLRRHFLFEAASTLSEKFENAALLLLSSHEKGAFRKRSSNRGNLKTPTFRWRVDGKDLNLKTELYENYVITILWFPCQSFSQTQIQSRDPRWLLCFKFLRCSVDGAWYSDLERGILYLCWFLGSFFVLFLFFVLFCCCSIHSFWWNDYWWISLKVIVSRRWLVIYGSSAFGQV